MDSNMGSGPQPHMPECVYCEADSASEMTMLPVHSTLYNTLPNMPSTSGEYHNEAARGGKGSQGVTGALAFHSAIERP